ncbi:conserved uncharacterized mitochondrial protein [Andalucia godoyi]|uniref:Conserved uncharacterized mitochondrial protein n=1 Tax=Andalucia godoyi TaxID=505711 RepID=A0A8K0AI91_ANDGO|nr:conserved uncharacterized mitochondrial protein [Andalucia godoyi]|eukprot:ANDGO_00348.mRNA.1 conserved uncharacterized mitochondrial protein
MIPGARPASSILLTAPLCRFPSSFLSSKNAASCDYRVLMLQRSSKSKFFPSSYVFPGGAVDAQDFATPYVSSSSTPFLESSSLASRPAVMQPGKNGSADAVGKKQVSADAFRVSAIRELFEESGYLYGSEIREEIGDARSKKTMDRDAVHAGSQRFAAELAQSRKSLDLGSLFPISRWITPFQEYDTRRFDCVFYAAPLHDEHAVADGSRCSSILDIQHDNVETVDTLWISPAEALRRCERGEIMLPPPTHSLLSWMDHFPRHADWKTAVARLRPETADSPSRYFLGLPNVSEFATILPALIAVPGAHRCDPTNKYFGVSKVLIFPGDSAYEECQKIGLENPQHVWDSVPREGLTVHRIIWRAPALYTVLRSSL